MCLHTESNTLWGSGGSKIALVENHWYEGLAVTLKCHTVLKEEFHSGKSRVPGHALTRLVYARMRACVCVCMRAQLLSHIQLFVTPCTVACRAPLSMGFSKREYWGGLPFPTPGDLPDPGMEPVSPALAGEFFPSEAPGKPAWLTCLLSPSLLLRSSYNTTFGAQTATKVSSSSLCIKHIVTPRIYIHTTFKNV